MVTFAIGKGIFTVWDGKTKYNYQVQKLSAGAAYEALLEPDDIYDLCQRSGCSEGQTIDMLLKYMHWQRILKCKHLAKLSIVFGLIGPRGSGKSVGAVQYAVIDYLLAGKTVWSNMDIELNVRYRDCNKVFRSEPWEKAALMDINDFETKYSNGLILIDELNIVMGDARRSMSNAALWFSYMLQEVRKRQINICYTLQSEDWADSRMRWQTDFYAACLDLALLRQTNQEHDLGRKSRWRMHDMSGLVTGEIQHAEGYDRNKVASYGDFFVWNTPFWGVYNSGQIQRYEKYDPTKANISEDKLTIDEVTFRRLTAGYSVIPELVVKLLDLKSQRVLRSDVWQILQVSDRADQTKIGGLLHSLGCEDFRASDGQRGYILPDRETLKTRLSELGVELNSN